MQSLAPHAPLSGVASILWLLLAPAGCHHEEHVATEAAEFPVTSPLKTDTELVKEYVAQIRAIQHIELRALERGYIQDVLVDEGQSVQLGQRMFQIMPMVYQAELQKAKASAQFAEIEYQNTKLLREGNVVSANELALARARLDREQAEVALARAHLSLTEIKAPFSGIMNRLHVRKGSLVAEGDLLTTLSDNSRMWVYFNVSEAEYLDYKSHLAPDDKLQVKLRMANGELFAHIGIVETIEAEFNNETGNIAFRATFPNPDGLLRHGETGNVLVAAPLRDALLIPQKATFDILDKKFVFVVGEDHVVRSKQIWISEELPHLYVVGNGLAGGEKILLEGLRQVRDGEVIATRFQQPTEVFASLEVPAQ